LVSYEINAEIYFIAIDKADIEMNILSFTYLFVTNSRWNGQLPDPGYPL